MKKALLGTATLALLFAGQALAKDSTGCGFGTMIFDGKSGMAPQVLAVTTNGTLGSQTFGISSGTLGCDTNGVISASASLFVRDNMEALAQNMAVGEGEALATLAELLAIDNADRAHFYAVTKAQFATLYTSADLTAEELLQNLHTVLANDRVLSQYAS